MPEPPTLHTRPVFGQKPVKGVFSIDSKHLLGIGGVSQASQRIFFYAEQLDAAGRVALQRLSRNFIPSGTKRFITREILLTQYQPEPSVYLNKVVPVMRRMEEAVQTADNHRQRQELFAAEFEYNAILRLDEEHVKAAFGLGLTYLERQEQHNADAVFHKIMRIEAAFLPEHKHLFNEFGIQMRKLGMYDEAMRYYSRAYRLCRTDEHLLYNIARTLYEKGRLKSSRAMLNQALRLNAAFPEAKAFLAYLDSRERGEAAAEPPLSALPPGDKPPGVLDTDAEPGA
ncbi:tetratricopeptide repeat protein [Desulfovibrio aerotolerans]|uniref:Tetratricopeptide repeat protein n=1 Tax=Solidesulfovibrio aerotolerans TaxID=295255 RepID=A0A7C9IKW4_9BACT|nr:tetratricopeptide repeat protein [Solidesulfovibrio aerotolerans]